MLYGRKIRFSSLSFVFLLLTFFFLDDKNGIRLCFKYPSLNLLNPRNTNNLYNDANTGGTKARMAVLMHLAWVLGFARIKVGSLYPFVAFVLPWSTQFFAFESRIMHLTDNHARTRFWSDRLTIISAFYAWFCSEWSQIYRAGSLNWRFLNRTLFRVFNVKLLLDENKITDLINFQSSVKMIAIWNYTEKSYMISLYLLWKDLKNKFPTVRERSNILWNMYTYN